MPNKTPVPAPLGRLSCHGIENYLKWSKAYGFMFVHTLITSADFNTASSFRAKGKKIANFIHNKNLHHNVVTSAEQAKRNLNFCGKSSKRLGVHNSLQTYGVPASATIIKLSEESW